MNKKPWMILSGCLFLSASQAMNCGSPVVNPDPELPAPMLASVTPPKASNAGGVMLTINGANFQPGVSVTIGGVAATMVAVVSANQLTCTIPAKAATCGQAPITVQNPDGKSATASDLFSYNPGKAGFAAATTLPTGTTPRQVLATDLDGDGNIDLVTTNSGSGDVSIRFGMGDGTFTAITTISVGGGSPFAIAAADMNADQKIDLVTAHNNSNNVKLIKATAARTYAVPTTAETFAAGAGPYAIALGDIDGKNGPDIVVANNGSSNVSLLLNSGGNAFATQVTSGSDAQPTAVLLGSFANTKLDFATANKNGNSATVRLNNGTNGFSGTATTISTGAKNPTAIVAGDWNADGKMDLAMANSGDMLAVIALGQGNGSFTAGTNPTVSTALGDHTIATADFNLDGKPDLAIANEKTGDVSILLGNGDGTFGAMTSFPVGTTPGSISIADLNKDSFPDLITTDRGANSVVIRLGQCS